MIIDIEDPVTFNENHKPNSINIPYTKLISNHSKYLDKNKLYYIMCNKGVKSKKAVQILSFYGYNVKQIQK